MRKVEYWYQREVELCNDEKEMERGEEREEGRKRRRTQLEPFCIQSQ